MDNIVCKMYLLYTIFAKIRNIEILLYLITSYAYEAIRNFKSGLVSK